MYELGWKRGDVHAAWPRIFLQRHGKSQMRDSDPRRGSSGITSRHYEDADVTVKV